MKVAIVNFKDYNTLSAAMDRLIEDSQFFLFTIVCGGTDQYSEVASLGEIWAKNNGAPIQFIFEENIDQLLNKIVQTADYLVAYNDGNPHTKRLIMKFSSEGKHGTVVNGIQ